MQRQDKHFLPLQTIIYNIRWEGKQLTSVTDGTHSYSYSYNEDGLRLRKVVDGTDTEYYYNGSVLMYMITGSGSTAIQQRFSYDAAGNLVAVVYKVGSGTSYIYYYLRNAQGDIVKLIDSSGNTVVEYMYDSWGKLIATTGSLANTVGLNQPFRYRGYVYDEETEFYYLQSRYYDPNTCRFISADVLLSTGQGVLGHNSFAYCGNNPVVRIDDQGQFWNIIGAIAIVVTTTIVSGVIGGLQEVANGGSFWTGAASGAVSGAIASAPAALATLTLGATAALTPGLTAAASAAGAVAGYGVKCAIKGEEFSFTEAAIDAGIGAVAGFIGGGCMGAFAGNGVVNSFADVAGECISAYVSTLAGESVGWGLNAIKDRCFKKIKKAKPKYKKLPYRSLRVRLKTARLMLKPMEY